MQHHSICIHTSHLNARMYIYVGICSYTTRMYAVQVTNTPPAGYRGWGIECQCGSLLKNKSEMEDTHQKLSILWPFWFILSKAGNNRDEEHMSNHGRTRKGEQHIRCISVNMNTDMTKTQRSAVPEEAHCIETQKACFCVRMKPHLH